MASGQASKTNVDEIGTAMDKHGHNGKASKVFVANSPDLPDPSEKLARLHIPRRLELQNLLKAWDLARREGSCSHISGNLVFRGPKGSGKETVARAVSDVLSVLHGPLLWSVYFPCQWRSFVTDFPSIRQINRSSVQYSSTQGPSILTVWTSRKSIGRL